MTGTWARDIDLDLDVIYKWGAKRLLTLIEPWEFDELRITALPQRAAEHGLIWHSLPITDGAAPDGRFLERWKRLGQCSRPNFVKVRKLSSTVRGGLVERELWHPCFSWRVIQQSMAKTQWLEFAGRVRVLLRLPSRRCLSGHGPPP